MESLELKQALEELRKQKERKFNQTVDLIINLRGIDLKKTNISLVINIPHKFKEKRVCGFLTKKSNLVKSITKPDFVKFKDHAQLRSLVKDFDFFIAHASLMPSVATSFGKALGPSGKMPSPQLGILMKEDDISIKEVLEKISKSVKIRLKEASVKIAVGKSDMKDGDIIDNIKSIYNAVENALPTKKENVKNIFLKFTMTKPLDVRL